MTDLKTLRNVQAFCWQFFKYGLCGSVAMFTDMVVFLLLGTTVFPCMQSSDPLMVLLGLEGVEISDELRARRYLITKAFSFVAANLVAYVLNILFVFKSGKRRRATEVFLFYLFSAVSIGIGSFIAWFTIRAMGMPTSFSYVVNAFVAIMINFLVRKYIIFCEAA
jgi:putative flippase GtrA